MGPVRQNPIQRNSSVHMCVCSSLCTIAANNTAQNRPDNFPSCPPDNHQCSDDVYLREGGGETRNNSRPNSGIMHPQNVCHSDCRKRSVVVTAREIKGQNLGVTFPVFIPSFSLPFNSLSLPPFSIGFLSVPTKRLSERQLWISGSAVSSTKIDWSGTAAEIRVCVFQTYRECT